MPRCRAAGRAGIALTVLVVTALATAAGAGPAAAQSVGERIESYAVAIEVRPTGLIHVSEAIAYDFGANPRHGIEREIPVRFHYDGRYDRIYRVRRVTVRAGPGTPAKVKQSDSGNRKVIRIGDPGRTITGLHTYTIDYDVEGALNGFPEHDELYWNAIGTEWAVAIGRPSVSVMTPAPTTAVTCFAGPSGSNSPCGRLDPSGAARTALDNPDLGPFEGLTVVVALPKGAVSATGPMLDERWSASRAFAVTPATGGASVLLLVAGMGVVGWLFWRRGRDRRLAGGVPGQPDPEGPGDDEAVPLFTDRDGPVAYRPPDDLRPAQVGVLVDERADPLDVTATIVDLAVRGYLAIEEVEKAHRWSKSDWKLTQQKEADGALLAYERMLLAAIFKGHTEVQLSDLKDTFHASLVRVEGQLYDDAVAQGWFTRRPDRVRSRWLVIGVLVAVAGAALTAALAATTHLGLVPLPLVLVGLVLAVGHRWMPARTAKGSATLARTNGFRRYIETAEADRMQFAEQENVWAAYLPYAIVFGATRKWAKAFAGLGAEQQAAVGSWYVSPYPFDSFGFSRSMESFTHTAAGAIVSTPSSSGSSGFSGGSSGGGGGGGGGGSW
jgi:uncharacterized protein (TIGR04222 family)